MGIRMSTPHHSDDCISDTVYMYAKERHLLYKRIYGDGIWYLSASDRYPVYKTEMDMILSEIDTNLLVEILSHHGMIICIEGKILRWKEYELAPPSAS
jgi:hypothetical protein